MILINILIGLIGLGIIVTFHEAGHMLAAKAVGIDVEVFSIGWGKRLFGFRWGQTEFRISPLPIGGYCRMKGEDALQEAMQEKDSVIPREDRSFYGAAPWKRVIVLLAGPVVNLLFAIIVLSIIWGLGFQVNAIDNRVVLASEYQEEGTPFPADEAGMRTGDRIIAIEGNEIGLYSEIQRALTFRANRPTRLSILRNGEIIELEVTPQRDPASGAGGIGVREWLEAVVGSVNEGSPAERSGVMEGDILRAINGMETPHGLAFQSTLASTRGEVIVTVERNGEHIDLSIIPNETEGRRLIGVMFAIPRERSPELGFFGAIGEGFEESVFTLYGVAWGLGQLFSGGVDVTQAVAGPLQITVLSGETARAGLEVGIGQAFVNFFRFLSLISIVLFFMNLLPIPALDGGQILFSVFDGLWRRPLRTRWLYRYQLVGMILIGALLILAIFGDVLFIFRELIPGFM